MPITMTVDHEQTVTLARDYDRRKSRFCPGTSANIIRQIARITAAHDAKRDALLAKLFVKSPRLLAHQRSKITRKADFFRDMALQDFLDQFFIGT